MSATNTSTAGASTAAVARDASREPARQIRPRKGLPGGRAVVGALLVTVAAVTVFAAYLDATAAPATRYVVAVADIEQGARIQPSDLGLVGIDLPSDLHEGVFTDPEEVIGRIAVAPVGARALVPRSAVVDTGDEVARPQVSFTVPASRALGERIAPGEHIDVVATFGSGSDAYTLRVLAGVLVVDRSGDDPVVFTVALDEPDEALALAHAVDVAEVTVVRTTEVETSPGDAYQAPGPRAGPEGGG